MTSDRPRHDRPCDECGGGPAINWLDCTTCGGDGDGMFWNAEGFCHDCDGAGGKWLCDECYGCDGGER